MTRFTRGAALFGLSLLGLTTRLEGQVFGLPVRNAGVPTGLTLAADFGFPNGEAGKGWAVGASGTLGLGPLGMTGSVARWDPRDGESFSSVGATGNLKIFGGPLIPISTYGASKLAGEALISAYGFMFGLVGRVFRFGNVVGPLQTHGVGLDFVRALLADPTRLPILGDGSQSKSYVYVDDVIDAMLVASATEAPYGAFNVATGDYVTVEEIADLAVEVVGLDPATVRYEYTGGDRGWKGDVPVVRLSIERMRALGWSPTRTSREALHESMSALADAIRAGRL